MRPDFQTHLKRLMLIQVKKIKNILIQERISGIKTKRQ